MKNKFYYLVFALFSLALLSSCSDDDEPKSGDNVDKSAMAVDLGLPSGTLWADRNVGADTPEDYGDYFAWGETKGFKSGKSDFSWSTYLFCNGSKDELTKYCLSSSFGYHGFVDNKEELDMSDDAASVNWDKNWRMPSFDQIKELLAKCLWTRTTSNGVNGYRVTGPNGNSIFLPAAGYRRAGEVCYAGSSAYYWSRSLSSLNSNDAYCLYFNSDYFSWDYNFRYSGESVRPVRR